ncbi:MORC family CW-type zinc finger protein 3a isoform X1 [Corythoichthys intestinalis]|uniref:MORC family CW-type zinc finger protein 3a isoform X1 n=1 Tax=Corythoichthys intestinalis TaxID=161448 RepID=UPI0025A5CA76|nr:MORC family CW-type zinc finger protein 3a isoform X1 [Corythoichthys intestinalis]
MDVQKDRGVPLSTLSPKYLHTNSTSHTWPFSAIAELIDNAYDPDVMATSFWIDKTLVHGQECLTFMDNGNGLDHQTMHKMLSFGYSDKVSVHGVEPIGMYGNGFKSGSMRLGRDAIVFSRSKDTSCVGMLSQSYLEEINAQQIVVPIVCFDHTNGTMSVRDEQEASLQDILRYSPFKTKTELLTEISAITTTWSTGATGTRIIIWNLRRTSTGSLEFDFKVDRYDIQIPSDVYEELNQSGERIPSHVPETVYSLRAYCSILYLKPRMHVMIRGHKVKTQLIAKSLANSKTDHYKPIFLSKRIPIIFGYNTKSREHYGVMMYHKNRLIKAYERIGCQLKPNSKGVGVIGVIECNFLEPMHNKQSFIENDKYRKTMASLTIKLDEYCNEIRYRLTRDDPAKTVEVSDISKRPDQNWVMCDTCRKWRKLPDGIDCNKLPESWYCHMNPDPQFRNCQVEEEAQDSDDDQPSYTKTYKQKEREDKKKLKSKQQVEEDRRHWENQHLAKLTLENQALQRNEKYLKRKLQEKSVQSPAGSWTDASSANEASKSPSVDAFPVISCVYSMADLTPSRKRKLSDEPRRTPTTPRRNSSVAPPPVDAGPTRDDTSETDDVYEVSSSSPVRKIKNERDEEIANETSDGTVPTAEQGTQFSGRVIKEESDSQILRILNIGEPLYIDSDDDTAKDVKREEPVANNRALSLNSLHRSSQTEETWPDKDYKSLYEKATDKIQQLVGSRADLLEGAQNKEGQEESGDITRQVDALVRELDKMTDERNRLRFQLKNAEIEKASLSRQCEELRARLRQEEREKDSPLQNGNSSAASDPDHLSRLIELRYNIGRLLVNEVPYLDLAQVNYECEVIDEILDQYLARNGADGTDAACSK